MRGQVAAVAVSGESTSSEIRVENCPARNVLRGGVVAPRAQPMGSFPFTIGVSLQLIDSAESTGTASRFSQTLRIEAARASISSARLGGRCKLMPQRQVSMQSWATGHWPSE